MPQPNQAKLDAFLGKMVGDLGAIATGAEVVLGDRLGLFRAMREGGTVTAAELAARTGTQERLVREWLSGQAAAGYIEYEEATKRSISVPSRNWCSPMRTARLSWPAHSKLSPRCGSMKRR